MDDDPPLHLGFEEAGTPFVSGAQNARVWTEQWVHAQLFCPNCGTRPIRRFPGNRPVADFLCEVCAEEYELKSQKGRFGRKVNDGAFRTMCERLAADNNPNLILLNYDLARRDVTDLFFVPKHFFLREMIEERKPLAPTAKRAGWVGCNIRLDVIPESGKIWFLREREAVPRADVMAKWASTLFLRGKGAAARGWLIEVMKCVERVGRREFTLDDVYAFEADLAAIYPGNNNVRPKIRQQLQVLRDQGFLQFLGGGRYRRNGSAAD
jgi:type II restriction enzyme